MRISGLFLYALLPSLGFSFAPRGCPQQHKSRPCGSVMQAQPPLRHFVSISSTLNEVPNNEDSVTATLIDEPSSLTTPTESILVQPPSWLQALPLGETISVPNTPIQITRVAQRPDIFVCRNLLPMEECEHLMEQFRSSSSKDMQDAETKTGKTMHRTKSKVAWVPHGHLPVTDLMTSVACQLFLHERLLEEDNDNDAWQVEPEKVQVASYEPTGRFDLHHDGHQRMVTVLTYLNGIAETWFPFAIVDENTANGNHEQTVRIPDKLAFDGSMTQDMTPEKDGLLVASSSLFLRNDNNTRKKHVNPHRVEVQPGDAVVFYNYNPSPQDTPPQPQASSEKDDKDSCTSNMTMDWRSLHAGLPAPEEKWIATNWIELVL